MLNEKKDSEDLMANRFQWHTVLKRMCQSDKTPEINLAIAVIEQAIADLYFFDIIDSHGERRVHGERISAVAFFNSDGFGGICSVLGIKQSFLKNAILKHAPRIGWSMRGGKFALTAEMLLPEDLEPVSRTGMARRLALYRGMTVAAEVESC